MWQQLLSTLSSITHGRNTAENKEFPGRSQNVLSKWSLLPSLMIIGISRVRAGDEKRVFKKHRGCSFVALCPGTQTQGLLPLPLTYTTQGRSWWVYAQALRRKLLGQH